MTAPSLARTASALRLRMNPVVRSQSRGPTAHTPATLGPGRPAPSSLWSRYKRLSQLGWPKRFPLIQFPNIPLIVAFVAGEATHLARGSAHADASAISYLALTVWAYEELVRGVNWFRRLLGLAYLASTIVHLALALHR